MNTGTERAATSKEDTMSKFFALLTVIFSLTVAETALAGDWGRGRGDHHGWNRPHSVYAGGGNHHYYGGGRHHGGHHSNRDLLLGLVIGTGIGITAAQPPAYYYPPQPVYQVPPQRCWTEWRPAYGLYDQRGRQFRQMVTVCQ